MNHEQQHTFYYSLDFTFFIYILSALSSIWGLQVQLSSIFLIGTAHRCNYDSIETLYITTHVNKMSFSVQALTLP